jgi:hypothetical protein
LAPAPSSTRVATAAPAAQDSESEGFFSSLARKVGLSSASADTTATATPAPAKPKVAEGKPPRPEGSIPKGAKNETNKSETKQAAVKPALKPSVTNSAPDTQQAAASVPAAPQGNSLVAGAQPIVSANSFESRFSGLK